MKTILLLFGLILSNMIYSQTAKDSLLKKDIIALVEEIEFMYGYDQLMREYIIFKTFNKSVTDSIENLADSSRIEAMDKRKFLSDSLPKHIYSKYINPKDAQHTERMITITKKYGFPSIARLKKYMDKEFMDPEFNPLIIFIHSPKKYWNELKELMRNEYENGTINQCQYGYALWHFTGRKDPQIMLDNGFKMVIENGKKVMKANCD